MHRCPVCRLEMDRDENAARNILALGRSATGVFGHSPS
ncbi:MAG TPA: zinc ribbon domain-containing protein [Planctomycetota bacterium]|nr:zinc ribbon domain-containing protein [Planctomycetota bacterium]